VSANRLPRLDAEQVLHLSAIEASLRNLQAQFPQINKSLKSRRDTTDPSIVANMVAGYYFVDSVLAQHADLFAMGNPKLFLVLNSLVLCGHDQERAPGPHRTSQLPNGGFMIRRATAFAMSSNGTTFIGPTRHGGGLPGCIVSRTLNPDRKHSLVALFRIPKIKRYFAKFLKEQSDQNYPIAASARPVAGSA
jgi:hypothetical protein